jgi:hypothetical protein
VTFFGKILVMINLALSLLLATWALGVYTTRTDWSSKDGPPEKVKGEVFRRQNQNTEAWKTLVAAEARWKADAAVVRLYEFARAENDRWYAAQLKELDVSPNPLNAVTWRAGVLVPDAKQFALDPRMPARPALAPAKDKFERPLKSLESYKKEFSDTQVEIKREMEKYQGLVKEDIRLTIELGGEKKLRHRLEMEQERQERVAAEIDHLKPLLVNSEVEANLLEARRVTLERRVAELKALGLTATRE